MEWFFGSGNIDSKLGVRSRRRVHQEGRMCRLHCYMTKRVIGDDGSCTSWKKLCEDGQLYEAFQAMDQMNQISFPVLMKIFYCLLQGCIRRKNLEAGREVHRRIVKSGFEANTFLGSYLIRMFATCRSLLEANYVFSRLSEPNVFTWHAIISAHVKYGRGKQAIKLYNRMRCSSVKPDGNVFVAALQACASLSALKQGKLIHGHMSESASEPDMFVWSTLIDMYAKCGSIKDARRVFDSLLKRNVVIWSAMIGAYAQHGGGTEALQLYNQMQLDGLKPDRITMVSALKACTSIAALEHGKLIHADIVESGFEMDVLLGNSLIDMYTKCGGLEQACKMFEILPIRDVVTWSAMIAAYAQHRNYKLAVQYFDSMLLEGLKPDDVTFVCLLCACSHLGLVKEGCSHFNSMLGKHDLSPIRDHFNCMVDLLGHAGCLNEAEDLLQTMPFHFNIVGWRSLLAHCKSYGNVELAKRCYGHILGMDRRDASGYVLMSNIYAHASSVVAADRIEEVRKSANAQKKPGKTYVVVDNLVHEFYVADQSHPWSSYIHMKLKRLTAQIKDNGYLPCLDLVPATNVK